MLPLVASLGENYTRVVVLFGALGLGILSVSSAI